MQTVLLWCLCYSGGMLKLFVLLGLLLVPSNTAIVLPADILFYQLLLMQQNTVAWGWGGRRELKE